MIKFYPAISHIIKSNQHLDLEKIRVPVYISFGPICFAILFKLNKPEKPKTLDTYMQVGTGTSLVGITDLNLTWAFYCKREAT